MSWKSFRRSRIRPSTIEGNNSTRSFRKYSDEPPSNPEDCERFRAEAKSKGRNLRFDLNIPRPNRIRSLIPKLPSKDSQEKRIFSGVLGQEEQIRRSFQERDLHLGCVWSSNTLLFRCGIIELRFIDNRKLFSRIVNLFAVHADPRVSAFMLSDQHTIKMPLETIQMIATGLREHGADDDMLIEAGILTKAGTPYRSTHKNHPATIWVSTTRANFMWAWLHGMALCESYSKRYGKTHACEAPLMASITLINLIPDGPLTPFAQCFPEEYKDSDPIIGYRRYYAHEKASQRWNHSDKPDMSAWL